MASCQRPDLPRLGLTIRLRRWTVGRYTRVARQEFPSTDPARVGRIDVAYVYMDERFQTIMITIPIEEDTEPRVLEELHKRVEAAAGAGPAEIEL